MCASSSFKKHAPFAAILKANSTKSPVKPLILDYNADDSFRSVETSRTLSLDYDEANLISETEEEANEYHSSLKQSPNEERVHDASATVHVESPKKSSKRNISFGTVLVRDYGMVLGDHPGCSCGPPVQLGWEYDEYDPLDVDIYEVNRDRRTLRQMKLNYILRTKLLIFAGHTEEELKTAEKEHKKTKMLRGLTRQLVPHHVEAALESACRKFKRVLKEDHWSQEKALYQKSQ